MAGPVRSVLQPGQTTSLDCSWTSPEPPEVTWMKDGIPLEVGSSGARRQLSNGSLLLSGSPGQAGLYQCSLSLESVGSLLSPPALVQAAGRNHSVRAV